MIEYVGSLEQQTQKNTDFRQVIFTGSHSQLVLMCLAPGEMTGDEVYQDADQFFRIEKGEATFLFDQMTERAVVDGDAVVVPAGTYHRVINSSCTRPLKLYTIYSPPVYSDGTVHTTKADAEAHELKQAREEQLGCNMDRP